MISVTLRDVLHPNDVDGLDVNVSYDLQATHSLQGEPVLKGVEVFSVDRDLETEKMLRGKKRKKSSFKVISRVRVGLWVLVSLTL